MTLKKCLANYAGVIKEIASDDYLDPANGGVDNTVWDSWTPTLANITLGNGTLACKYKQIGKTCVYEFILNAGSTTTIGASIPTFTLPIQAASRYTTRQMLGELTIYDSSASVTYSGAGVMTDNSTSTKVGLFSDAVGGTYGFVTPATTGIPITIANGDIIVVSGIYEAA